MSNDTQDISTPEMSMLAGFKGVHIAGNWQPKYVLLYYILAY